MRKLLLSFLLVTFALAGAQKTKMLSDDFGFLKGVEEVNVQFDFSNVTFYKEKMDENTYVNKRIAEIEGEKGKEEADKWKNDWEYTKKTSIPDKFFASFHKYGKLRNAADGKAKYTLIVETTWVYPGWFGGVMNEPSKVSTLLRFVEAANPGNVLAEMESLNAPGDNMVGIPNNNDRIAEAYAKTSKTLAGLIEKKRK